jgi:predicted nucleic acid-binding protein
LRIRSVSGINATIQVRAETVYIETSVVSLLVANPSRDLITAANQQVTRDWWRLRRQEFVCVASSEVLREASKGDPQEVRKRLEVLSGLVVLQRSPEADRLMIALLATGALPARAQADAAHLAIAAVAQADYLLTWNCRHLANAQILRRLEREALRHGWTLPKVCTPLQLMGELAYESRPDP